MLKRLFLSLVCLFLLTPHTQADSKLFSRLFQPLWTQTVHQQSSKCTRLPAYSANREYTSKLKAEDKQLLGSMLKRVSAYTNVVPAGSLKAAPVTVLEHFSQKTTPVTALERFSQLDRPWFVLADTKVNVKEQGWMQAKDVQAGMKIYNNDSSRKYLVSQTECYNADHVLQLSVNNQVLTVLSEQFFLSNRGDLVSAKQLQVGDLIADVHQCYHRIQAIENLEQVVDVVRFDVRTIKSKAEINLEKFILKLSRQYTKIEDLQSKRDNKDLSKQVRLLSLLFDNRAPSWVRGWILNELRSLDGVKKKRVRVPPGMELAHRRGYESAKGYGYEFSSLQSSELHRLQHKYDCYGVRNPVGCTKFPEPIVYIPINSIEGGNKANF